MTDTTTSRRWPRDLAVLVAAVLIGAGAFAFLSRDGGGGGGTAVDLPSDFGDGELPDIEVAAGDGQDVPVVAPEDASDPEAAVASFLAAEVARDFESSFALLDGATQARVVNVASWTAEHGTYPKIVGFDIQSVEGDEVTTALALDSRLDPVLGLVPARALGTWVVEETGGTFRVNFDDSVIAPVYPDPAPAADVALAWVEGVQAGEDVAELQGINRVAGQAGFVGLLADSEGAFQAGEPFVLPPDAGNANLLSRFGASIVDWGRAVPVTGAVDVTVVLGPVGDEWLVVGVIAP